MRTKHLLLVIGLFISLTAMDAQQADPSIQHESQKRNCIAQNVTIVAHPNLERAESSYTNSPLGNLDHKWKLPSPECADFRAEYDRLPWDGCENRYSVSTDHLIGYKASADHRHSPIYLPPSITFHEVQAD